MLLALLAQHVAKEFRDGRIERRVGPAVEVSKHRAPERVAALRAAFDETMKDPAFLADAKKTALDVSPVSGAEVDAMIASLYATPKDVIAKKA